MENNIFAEADNAVRILRQSPIGPIALAASSKGLARVTIMTEGTIKTVEEKNGDPAANAIAEKALRELRMYFAGDLDAFSVSVDLHQLTPFRRRVLEETARIPFGEVRTYGGLAARIKKPRSARAVGGALAMNPAAIVIPCHRVVAQDGALHGFSSPNGIATKAQLLQHEGAAVQDNKVILK